MDVIIEELNAGLPSFPQFVRVCVRLVIAAFLGAIIGYQRERVGKAAGLRTHMLVAAGGALFVLAGAEAGMSSSDISRVIQGLAAGMGFLGAGAILKSSDERSISGLTTAAGIWMRAAVGVAVGLGRWGTAGISVLLTWTILTMLMRGKTWNEQNSAENRESA